MSDFMVLLLPLLAGILIIVSHVPLGQVVVARGIIFIDLAIAQIAVLGITLSSALNFDPGSINSQLIAIISAVTGGLVLQWTERQWPTIQEALIGVIFVLAAAGSMLLLANNPHGSERFQELLSGQILWIDITQLLPAGISLVLLIIIWQFTSTRFKQHGFYVIFALNVTISVQLVGVLLVFSSLIIPALAIRQLPKRLAIKLGYLIGILAYSTGLLISLFTDLPASPLIICMLALYALLLVVIKKQLALY